MKRHLVYALGSDPYWLGALSDVGGEEIAVHPILFEQGLPDDLAPPDPAALLLLDATGQQAIEAAVQQARRLNWKYVIVVAADPAWRLASTVLRGKAAYDCWQKTYDVEANRRSLEVCLAEIARQDDAEGGVHDR